MTLQQINEILEEIHCGSFTRVVYRTSLHADRNHKGVEVIKVVKAVVRFGVDYQKMASVKQKAAQKAALGLAASTHALCWGTWISRFLIENKGEVYVRLACSKNNVNHKSVVLGYYVNGREVSKEEAKAITRPSDWTQKDDDLDVYTKKVEDIVSIGKHYSDVPSTALGDSSLKEEEGDEGFLGISHLVRVTQEKLQQLLAAAVSCRNKKRRAKQQGADCGC